MDHIIPYSERSSFVCEIFLLVETLPCGCGVNEKDSCLGVISLPVSTIIISVIQLSYSLVSLIMISTSNDLSPLTDTNSLTTLEALKYSQQIFIYATGFVASCLLGIGSLMSVEFLKNVIKSKNIIISESLGSLTI